MARRKDNACERRVKRQNHTSALAKRGILSSAAGDSPVNLAKRRMKIAIAQINSTVGDFDGNSDKITDAWRRADEAGA
ncbi:MAG: hypothetical protein HN969_06015, partial [Verrucomicrobia bacterium]|nr:hypothetical protein [Verrucomicrobiota bacterium]